MIQTSYFKKEFYQWIYGTQKLAVFYIFLKKPKLERIYIMHYMNQIKLLLLPNILVLIQTTGFILVHYI